MGISRGSGPLALALAIVAAIHLIGCSTSSPPDVGAMHIRTDVFVKLTPVRNEDWTSVAQVYGEIGVEFP